MLAKTSFLILPLLIGTAFSYAQSGGAAIVGSSNSSSALNSTMDINQYLREYYGQRKGGVTQREFEGETYLHDEWKTYVVSVTFEKEPIKIDQGRYDTYTDEIVLQLDGESRYLRSEFIKEFRIEDEHNDEVRQFINPRYQDFSPKDDLPILEVLTTGSISLFREVKVSVVANTGRYDPSTGDTETAERLVKGINYYLERGGYLYPIANKTRFAKLLDSLSDEGFDERKYAREHGLRLTRPEDWPKLVAASNES